jgi:hypothetical protein
MNKLLAIALLYTASLVSGGFVGMTLVKTPQGYKRMDELKKWDLVMSCEDGIETTEAILTIKRPKTSMCIMVSNAFFRIYCADTQAFYVSDRGYVEAKDLEYSDRFSLGCLGASVIRATEAYSLPFEYELYDFVISNTHNYKVGSDDVLVHDSTPIEVDECDCPNKIDEDKPNDVGYEIK